MDNKWQSIIEFFFLSQFRPLLPQYWILTGALELKNFHSLIIAIDFLLHALALSLHHHLINWNFNFNFTSSDVEGALRIS